MSLKTGKNYLNQIAMSHEIKENAFNVLNIA